MKRNIKASFGFQFPDLLKTCANFFGIMAVLLVGFPALALLLRGHVSGSFSGYGVIAAIFLFVVGIAAPRSYVRMDCQMGVSRATSFLAQLLNLLCAAAILCVAGELLTALAQLIFRNADMVIMDLYQMMYNDSAALGFGGHLLSVAFNLSLCVCGYACGMFYTYLFWRLNKLGKWLAAIAMVVLFNVVLNASVFAAIRFDWLRRLGAAFLEAAQEGPLALILLFLVIAAVASVIDWLLLRRAHIRASK